METENAPILLPEELISGLQDVTLDPSLPERHSSSRLSSEKDVKEETRVTRKLILRIPRWKTMVVYPSACSRHRTGECHQEHPSRLSVLCDPEGGVLRSMSYEKNVEWIERCDPVSASDVLRVHDHKYFAHLCASCESGDVAKELKKFDPDTVLSGKDTLRAAMKAAGAVITAVDAVAHHRCRNCFVAVRPPGHHAGPRGAVPASNFHQRPEMCSCGFCLLNNVAIGAAYARAQYGRTNRFEVDRETAVLRRVAILDFDVHHGNGTEQIVREMQPHKYRLPLPPSWAPQHDESHRPWLNEKDAEEVWFGSVHLHRDGFYPCSGPDNTSETFTSTPNIVNVGLPMVGPEDQVLRKRLTASKRRKLQDQASRLFRERMSQKMLPRLKAFRPDIIFVSAGFDAHHSDFYYFLKTEDYAWVTEKICEIAKDCCDGRVISVLEGGYQTKPVVPKSKRSSRRRTGNKENAPSPASSVSSVETSPESTTTKPLAPLAACVHAHVSSLVKYR